MHRKTMFFAGLMLAGLAMVPSDVAGQGKKAQPAVATAQDYHFIEEAKSVTGQLLAFDDSTKTLSVRIDATEWVPNPKFKAGNGQFPALMRHQNDLAREQQALANTKNPNTARTHMNNIARLQNLIGQEMAKASNVNPNNMPFLANVHPKDFDLELQEKIVYRKMNLSAEYDDTGNIKTYTKEELAKLKGTDSKPGYKAAASEFHPGQIVFVYLSPAKTKGSSSSSTAAKDKDKDAAADDNVMPKPTVRMLIIDKEGKALATTPPDKKKKN